MLMLNSLSFLLFFVAILCCCSLLLLLAVVGCRCIKSRKRGGKGGKDRDMHI